MKVLLVSPANTYNIYAKAKVKVGIPRTPIVSTAILSASLLENKMPVDVIDLSLSEYPLAELKKKINTYKPDIVGFYANTCLLHEALGFCKEVKKYAPGITTILGGPHPTIFPAETAADPYVDIAAKGEGDYTLPEIVHNFHDLSKVRGIAYKEDGKVVENENRPLIEDLDALPLPAWHLFQIKKYKTSIGVSCRKNPVGVINTSRGCVGRCSFCTKKVFGDPFRKKSAGRAVEEIEWALKAGFGEIHVREDEFATDIGRAKEICRLIIKKRLKFPWNMFSGIRVNHVDEEFLRLAHEAGCYSVSFGLESGNQALLNNIRKGTTLEQARAAFRITRKLGLETIGFFMFGLPGETEETMRQTIEFAKELNPTFAKVTLTLPFPGTPLFEELERRNLIVDRNWERYNFHSPHKVWRHDNLNWDTMEEYYHIFYKEFYIRPSYILHRFLQGVRKGTLFIDAKYAFDTFVKR